MQIAREIAVEFFDSELEDCGAGGVAELGEGDELDIFFSKLAEETSILRRFDREHRVDSVFGTSLLEVWPCDHSSVLVQEGLSWRYHVDVFGAASWL